MKFLLTLLHLISALYAGACLSIAYVDFRFIASIDETEQITMALLPLLKNMGMLMAPTLVIMLLLCLVFSVKAFRERRALKTHLPLAVFLIVLGITLIVHIPINIELLSGEVADEDLRQVIRRWDIWHWVRTAFAILLPLTVFKFYYPLLSRES